MRITTLAIILVSILFLTGCSTDENLPPEPGAPGTIFGQATQAQAQYADPGSYFTVSPPKVEFHTADDTVELVISVTGQDFVYQSLGIYHKPAGEWGYQTFEGEKAKNWIIGDATYRATLDRAELKKGKYFVVAYACNKKDGGWNCHGNRWMLNKFFVEHEDLPPTPVMPGEEAREEIEISAEDIKTIMEGSEMMSLLPMGTRALITFFDGNGQRIPDGEFYFDGKDVTKGYKGDYDIKLIGGAYYIKDFIEGDFCNVLSKVYRNKDYIFQLGIDKREFENKYGSLEEQAGCAGIE